MIRPTSPSRARRISAASRPYFLPTAQWEQVRDAFWARTGFPVAPDAAVEQLKTRLSEAFDRFLEGVADNRQVTFDDDGWRLKTDPAEPPDPAQSDRLAELHRYTDTHGYTEINFAAFGMVGMRFGPRSDSRRVRRHLLNNATAAYNVAALLPGTGSRPPKNLCGACFRARGSVRVQRLECS